MKPQKKLPRERNQFVVAALMRKAGSHRKSNKAKRKLANQTSTDVFQLVLVNDYNLYYCS